MKYIIVLGDGMSGRALGELGGRTTLEAAMTPAMDALAKEAELGMASMVPEGMAPGSDTANLSVLGYDPKRYYTGRSPLEAMSIGVDLKETDVSFRCNLVTLSEEEGDYAERTILDHSADEISSRDGAILIDALRGELEKDGWRFYAGTSYRHLLVQEKGRVQELTPPHDILGRKIGPFLPEDPALRAMMEKSYEILSCHPLNQKRRRDGLHPANAAWFWGAGTKPKLPGFQEKTGKRAVMISAVDLLKGIAVCAGMDRILVEGANGGLHTNYKGKAQAAVQALVRDGYDFAYIHVEAPDEMGHQGSARDKIRSIEQIDEMVVKTLVREFQSAGEDYRLLILPDHPTPVEVRTHTAEPVPYLLYDSRRKLPGENTYCEKTAAGTGREWKEGFRLIEHLLQEDLC